MPVPAPKFPAIVLLLLNLNTSLPRLKGYRRLYRAPTVGRVLEEQRELSERVARGRFSAQHRVALRCGRVGPFPSG